MSNQDEEKIRQSRRRLSWGDDEKTEVIAEKSLSELLQVHPSAPRPAGAPAALTRAEDSDRTLEFDSESWVEQAPRSEVSREGKRLTPSTLEMPLQAPRGAARPPASVITSRPSTRNNPREAVVSQAPRPPGTPIRQAESDASEALSREDDLRPLGLAPYQQWNLKQTPLTRILRDLLGTRDATVLELRAGRNRAQILVAGGQLYEVRLLPCSVKRSLTASLVRRGRLNPAQAEAVRDMARTHALSEAQALLQITGLLPAAEIRAAVRARMRHILGRLMKANLVEASAFRLDQVPAGLRIAPLSLVGILFSRVRAYYEGANPQARAQFAQRWAGMKLARKTQLAFSINHLKVPIHERQLLDRVLTKQRDYEAVLRNSPVGEATTVAILAGLEAVGLLEVERPGLSNAESSSWAEDYTMAVARIESMEGRLEAENYFDIFGVHWSTYDTEIERAYNELSTHFSLLNQPLGLTASQRKRLGVVRERLQKIYDILSDPPRRARYRRTLVPPAHMRRAAQKFDTLGAAAFRKKAFHSALDYYQRLLSLEPSHSAATRLLPLLIARTSSRR